MVCEALKWDNKESPRIEDFLELITLERRLISPKRLTQGGRPMFPILKRNHHKPSLGINVARPLLIRRRRLTVRI